MDLSKTRLIDFFVESFRVFKDGGGFDFAPITILTGKNNSGKSSLIKAIRLFAESIKATNGLYLDFTAADLKLGSFGEVKSHYNKDNNEMSFSFTTEIKNEDSSKTEYFYSSRYNQNGLSYFDVSIKGVTYITVTGNRDGKGFKYTSSSIALPDNILNLEKLKKKLNHLSDESFEKIKNEFITFLANNNEMHVSDSSSYKDILKQNNHPLYNVIEAIYYALENASSNKIKPIFEEILSHELTDILNEKFRKEYVSDYINHPIENLNFIPQNLFSCFSNMDVFESVRSGQSELFKYTDNLKLTELFKEYQKLPTLDYHNLDFESDSDSIDQKLFINRWLHTFGIIDHKTELKIKSASGGYQVSAIKNGKELHLTEMGYGFTQIIPIILKICMSENKIIIIEEPESNLHPALQSRLADFFASAAKNFNIQFIIETHSEYLMRKLQYLTAKIDSNLNPEDTVIYYFYPPDEIPGNEDQIKRIKIQSDGSLTNDFGTGFFDEAANWKFELLVLKNSQKN